MGATRPADARPLTWQSPSLASCACLLCSSVGLALPLTFPLLCSTIPLFLLLTVLLFYSVAWFSYLILAQADPPASSQNGSIAPFLPFLPYSPLRCLKVNWAAALYASSAIKVALPAVLDWSYRRVMVLGTQGGGIVKCVDLP